MGTTFGTPLIKPSDSASSRRVAYRRCGLHNQYAVQSTMHCPPFDPHRRPPTRVVPSHNDIDMGCVRHPSTQRLLAHNTVSFADNRHYVNSAAARIPRHGPGGITTTLVTTVMDTAAHQRAAGRRSEGGTAVIASVAISRRCHMARIAGGSTVRPGRRRELPRIGGPMLDVLDQGSDGATRSTPLLFVHGAFHGTWCWSEHFLDFFAERGVTAQWR